MHQRMHWEFSLTFYKNSQIRPMLIVGGWKGKRRRRCGELLESKSVIDEFWKNFTSLTV